MERIYILVTMLLILLTSCSGTYRYKDTSYFNRGSIEVYSDSLVEVVKIYKIHKELIYIINKSNGNDTIYAEDVDNN